MTATLIIPFTVGLWMLLIVSLLVSTRCRIVESHRHVMLEVRRIERERLDSLARGRSRRG